MLAHDALDHWPKVFGFAQSLTKDRSKAEDFCQEAFLRLLDRVDSIDMTRSVLPLLLTIVRNLVVSDARRHRPESWDASIHPDPEDARAVDPAVEAERRESAMSVRVALGRLPDNWRAALYLKDGLGLSYAEIAEIIDVSVDTVRTMLHRARQRLRQLLPEGRAS